MNEIIFIVEEAAEGGFIARALGASIITEGETMQEIKFMVKDAMKCHFDTNELPKISFSE
jgi:hypothetical protein